MKMIHELIDEPFLITGAAGFIGFHLCRRLLATGAKNVFGIDNLCHDDNVKLKHERLKLLSSEKKFNFAQMDINDSVAVEKLFVTVRPKIVIHLAAQAGVHQSLAQPQKYITNNIGGFVNILEACRNHKPQHLLYASSSSVYSDLTGVDETTPLPDPLSIYAATKVSNEQIAKVYGQQLEIHSTGLRFFTVYGPWGRRDMAVFKFAEKIINEETLRLANGGTNCRSFTYISDVIESIVRLISFPPQSSRVINIGGGESHDLNYLIALLENSIGKKIKQVEHYQSNSSDVAATVADCRALQNLINFSPSVSLKIGVEEFCIFFKQWINKR